MTDRLTTERRSRLMSHVHSKDTTPELRVRHLLHVMGYRFRLYRSDLPGKPDVVLPKYGVAIFVNGCFWHRHKGCKKASTPSTNVDFWNEKFRRNIERDRKNIRMLRREGWRVLVVWECQTKYQEKLQKVLNRFLVSS